MRSLRIFQAFLIGQLVGPAALADQPTTPPKTETSDSWKRFQVGDAAPLMLGMAADGSFYDTRKSNLGKVVLVAYWSVQDKDHEQAVRAVERLYQRHGDRKDLQIITFWTDGEQAFLEEMQRRGRKFFGRRKWWPMAHLHRRTSPTDKTRISDHDVRPGRTPVLFVLDRKFRFQAIDVPVAKVECTLDAIFADKKPNCRETPKALANDSKATPEKKAP